MPVFKYTGYNRSGSQTEGVIEADGQKDAAFKIRSKGIYPKDISEAASESEKSIFRKPSALVVSDITRRLSTLVTSGVPLAESIGSIAMEQKGRWKNILLDIKDRLSGGASLSRAMQSHPYVFPDFYTGMIAAGESSGKLGEVLIKLADYLEGESDLKNRIKTALVYPVFMAFVSIAIVLFLFTFVIPKISKIFEETSASLPLITIVLMWISIGLKNFWWLLLIFAAGAIVLFRKVRETRKDLIDAFLLKDPTRTIMSLYMLRFTMTLGFLLSGGLPILNAMQLSSRVTGNVVLEKKITSATDHVAQGARLSASLEGFPPTLLQIISTGEQTGKLAEVLTKTARSYESEFDRKLQRAVSLLEPALILAMGLIVGLIVAAVLLPIFELNQMMQ